MAGGLTTCAGSSGRHRPSQGMPLAETMPTTWSRTPPDVNRECPSAGGRRDDYIAEQRGPVFSLYFHPAMGVAWDSHFRFRPTYPSAAILSQMRLYVLKPST
jgi:hypothetical protein